MKAEVIRKMRRDEYGIISKSNQTNVVKFPKPCRNLQLRNKSRKQLILTKIDHPNDFEINLIFRTYQQSSFRNYAFGWYPDGISLKIR